MISEDLTLHSLRLVSLRLIRVGVANAGVWTYPVLHLSVDAAESTTTVVSNQGSVEP